MVLDDRAVSFSRASNSVDVASVAGIDRLLEVWLAPNGVERVSAANPPGLITRL